VTWFCQFHFISRKLLKLKTVLGHVEERSSVQGCSLEIGFGHLRDVQAHRLFDDAGRVVESDGDGRVAVTGSHFVTAFRNRRAISHATFIGLLDLENISE
jgi:hypothetical protein